MTKTKEQAAPGEQEAGGAGQEKKKLSELDLIGYLASRYAIKELNKLLAETGVFKALLDKIMIADFKASVCYELLTESQRQQARQLLKDRYKAAGIEFEPIEEVLERAKAKL
jgi:hypothetical protein